MDSVEPHRFPKEKFRSKPFYQGQASTMSGIQTRNDKEEYGGLQKRAVVPPVEPKSSKTFEQRLPYTKLQGTKEGTSDLANVVNRGDTLRGSQSNVQLKKTLVGVGPPKKFLYKGTLDQPELKKVVTEGDESLETLPQKINSSKTRAKDASRKADLNQNVLKQNASILGSEDDMRINSFKQRHKSVVNGGRREEPHNPYIEP
mmetsp:Transcript_38994/g.59323  ORF Transcript_38994/g.59323 Transcript_38994/m.59323 type:complete len:202 (+) Transcript_38994:264-869(+)